MKISIFRKILKEEIQNFINKRNNPFYDDYGEYIFGENPEYYGKFIEKNTPEENKILELLGKWMYSYDIPEIIPYFEKLYKAKPYYPEILDPGNVHVWKATFLNKSKEDEFKNFIKTANHIPYKTNIDLRDSSVSNDFILFDKTYEYIPEFKAQSWSVDKYVSLNSFFDPEGSILLSTHTSKSKFLFKPWVLYNLPSKYYENLDEISVVSKNVPEGEKETIGLGDHKCKIIIHRNYYNKLIN